MPAVMKLRDEMAENAQHSYVQSIGEFLLQHLHERPESASHIMTEGKTIKGSLAAMSDVARKQQVDGCAVLTDEEGYAIVLQYFGIPEKPAAAPKSNVEFDVSLDDLLGRFGE